MSTSIKLVLSTSFFITFISELTVFDAVFDTAICCRNCVRVTSHSQTWLRHTSSSLPDSLITRSHAVTVTTTMTSSSHQVYLLPAVSSHQVYLLPAVFHISLTHSHPLITVILLYTLHHPSTSSPEVTSHSHVELSDSVLCHTANRYISAQL